MKRILVCEDEDVIREFVVINLKRVGYEVYDVNCGEEALRVFDAANGNFDIVLLDIMMPGIDGFQVCKELRKRSSTIGIIMLSAKTQEMDKVNGLMIVADDYITKPFSVRELVARVNRVFLRTKSDDSSSVIHAGSISYDLDKKEARRAGQVIALSSLENRILDLLFTNHDKAVSRNAVLDCIWEATGNDVYDHTVTVYMKRIRAKLGEDVIKTVKGIGYRVDSDETL